METTFSTIRIGSTGLRALEAKITGLNKRAAKHGLNPIKMAVTKTVAFVRCYAKGFGVSEDLHTVEVFCDGFPVIEGWRIIAKIEFDPQMGNIVKTLPGIDEIDPRYRTVGTICEHCHSKRRRKDVIVLRHESGEERIVGRNCLADFIRDGNADSLIRFAEMAEHIASWGDDEGDGDCEYEGGFGGGAGAPVVSMLNYLATVSVCIRKFGWTSRTAAQNLDGVFPTVEIAGECYWGRKSTQFRERHELYPTDKDLSRAAAALDWAAKQAGNRSEYLHNLALLARCENLNWKYDGFVASMISAYAKSCDEEIERKARAKERVFIGKVGERMRNVPVKVVRMRFSEGMYGTKTIVTLEATVGEKRAVITWFASGDKDEVFSEGDSLVVDATVKKHEAHEKYGDSTIVTRVTVKSQVQATAA